MSTSNGGAASSTTFNGGVCTICARPFLGSHRCSVMDLIRRADELRDMALKRFEELNPQPTRGPRTAPTLDQRGCPCRTESGGSGVCGCILGGPQVTS